MPARRPFRRERIHPAGFDRGKLDAALRAARFEPPERRR
jgi:hypothetical protein